MKGWNMNKPTSLFTASPSPPLIQNRRCSCELQIDVLQSLKVLRPGYWEDLQFNNTSKLASRGLCFVLFFLKKKKWLHRERERERKERKKKREKESEYFHWFTQRAFCRTSWADLQRWWRKRESRTKGGIQQAESAHTSTTIFLCISRPPTTWMKVRKEGIEKKIFNRVLLVLWR